MSLIFPFNALRPHPSVAGQVAAVPYDVVETEEARQLAAGNPLSFLRVSRAEIDLPPDTHPYSDEVYACAARNFDALRAAAPMLVEQSPSLYVYRLHMGTHVQTGIAACFALDEYDRDLILKHERTRPDKEDDRTRHILTIRAQTGPVFLTYVASPAVDEVAARVGAGVPLYDLTASDGVRHVIWRVPDEDARDIEAAFAAVPALYIADGHHRAASAARARRQLAAEGPGEHDRFLAVAFPHDQMQILPYNRVVRDLQGMTPQAFAAQVAARFATRPGGPAMPVRRGEVAMYLAGQWSTIVLGTRPEALAPGAALDVSLLQDGVLGPLLGIADVRTDERVDFVGGIRGTGELERLVDSGQWAVAFSLAPVSIDDLMRISDAGGIMPPKSTWFEPKLRDGLLVHVI